MAVLGAETGTADLAQDSDQSLNDQTDEGMLLERGKREERRSTDYDTQTHCPCKQGLSLTHQVDLSAQQTMLTDVQPALLAECTGVKLQ